MSDHQMNAVWASELPPRLRYMALAVVAESAWRNDPLWVTLRGLAAKTGYTERTVRSLLRELEEIGYLEPLEPGPELRERLPRSWAGYRFHPEKLPRIGDTIPLTTQTSGGRSRR